MASENYVIFVPHCSACGEPLIGTYVGIDKVQMPAINDMPGSIQRCYTPMFCPNCKTKFDGVQLVSGNDIYQRDSKVAVIFDGSGLAYRFADSEIIDLDKLGLGESSK